MWPRHLRRRHPGSRFGGGALDHGVHFGIAFGARALRTRFVFPGAAFGLSWERLFLDGDDVTMMKVGVRAALDLDLF